MVDASRVPGDIPAAGAGAGDGAPHAWRDSPPPPSCLAASFSSRCRSMPAWIEARWSAGAGAAEALGVERLLAPVSCTRTHPSRRQGAAQIEERRHLRMAFEGARTWLRSSTSCRTISSCVMSPSLRCCTKSSSSVLDSILIGCGASAPAVLLFCPLVLLVSTSTGAVAATGVFSLCRVCRVCRVWHQLPATLPTRTPVASSSSPAYRSSRCDRCVCVCVCTL